MADGREMLAKRLEGSCRVHAGLQHEKNMMPCDALLSGQCVHVQGQKDVADRSLFRSSKIARADADNFKGLVADMDQAAENVGIAPEAVVPIIPGEDRIGIEAGAAVIGGSKKAAERGLEA